MESKKIEYVVITDKLKSKFKEYLTKKTEKMSKDSVLGISTSLGKMIAKIDTEIRATILFIS